MGDWAVCMEMWCGVVFGRMRFRGWAVVLCGITIWGVAGEGWAVIGSGGMVLFAFGVCIGVLLGCAFGSEWMVEVECRRIWPESFADKADG